ncbi:SCO family protein [Streptomyces sp. NPDC087300]|uniref:SCO family protein n=1 Tax=Streptomyces sp. NPDC087300 TaxID=3365780 RepID=UPI0037F96043
MRTKSSKSTRSTAGNSLRTGRGRTLAAAAVLTAAALTLAACGSEDKPTADVSVESDSGKAATVLDNPYKKPNLVLKDVNGKKYDLRKETEGKATLLYFGYTHCPDACPLTMGNIAVAKKELEKSGLSKAERDKLRVVFVTTDPDRDTAPRLKEWLNGVDKDFVGLTGDFATIQAGASQVAISVEPTKKDKKGKLVSMHGKQVIAYSPKTDKGYVLYSDEATAADYTRDLPKIIKGENP